MFRTNDLLLLQCTSLKMAFLRHHRRDKQFSLSSKAGIEFAPFPVRLRNAGPMTVARRTPGPASANLQGRKPREGNVGGAAWAMGI